MADDIVGALIDKMFELQENYTDLLTVRESNRRTLRDLASQGMLSDEQVAQVYEVYPERAPRKTLAERAAEAQQLAKDLAAKAKEEAAA